MSLKIGIIGGGFAGLTLGYELSKKGHQITIFEKEKKLGGLASSFKVKGWSWPLDRFYRHVFSSDKDFLSLVKELEVEEKVIFKTNIGDKYIQPHITLDNHENKYVYMGINEFSSAGFGYEKDNYSK